jgi:aryl-alcohol dehydrogenase-like predicted oxidoreductase
VAAILSEATPEGKTFDRNEKETTMRYRLLGNSGLRVSEAALGAMTFGDDWGWGAAKDEARKLYDAFREAGDHFIDAAPLFKKTLLDQRLPKLLFRQSP